MPDSEAKKKWMKENSRMVAVKMMTKGDADILQYLEKGSTSAIIKASLREYIAKHPEGPVLPEKEKGK